MKKLIAIATFALPLVLAPMAYAQTTTSPSAGSSGNVTPPPVEGANRSADGDATKMNRSPVAPASGTTGTTATPGDAGDATQAISGWSVKDKIIGTAVYNENDDKIGDISDVVLASDGKAVYYVIGAGGFLGVGTHDVAIPFEKVNQTGERMVLQGYTKDQLKALPQVKVDK
ncbi:MAG TPA: PRC-barrel domain-containing protein [Candidimonas sp.]|nr:PRC-barrel domain-containing protein [Candidimonas sp.]